MFFVFSFGCFTLVALYLPIVLLILYSRSTSFGYVNAIWKGNLGAGRPLMYSFCCLDLCMMIALALTSIKLFLWVLHFMTGGLCENDANTFTSIKVVHSKPENKKYSSHTHNSRLHHYLKHVLTTIIWRVQGILHPILHSLEIHICMALLSYRVTCLIIQKETANKRFIFIIFFWCTGPAAVWGSQEAERYWWLYGARWEVELYEFNYVFASQVD